VIQLKKLGIILASFALLFLFITGCTSTKPNTKNDPNTKTEETKQVETKTPLAALKEIQKKLNTIKGFKYSRTTQEKTPESSYNNTETGEEQLNPEISHFTNSKNNEYYYDKQYIYAKQMGQWLKKQNTDGKVLATLSFPNLVSDLIKFLGTKEQAPGITIQKNGNEYVITLDFMIAKSPTMTEAEFTEFKQKTLSGKEEITVDATTFEPKKYVYHLETKDGKLRNAEMTLTPYDTPVTVPAEVSSSAKQAQ
jgi:hypothetical protein